ncbi:hypothetical protein ABIE66_000745 [Peribacillus sp. B2I2]|uniref:transcriptional regulator n=1 Tax=Peribacillus sp. B2I2 TaxID=3156468 RepID=UPI003512EAA8
MTKIKSSGIPCKGNVKDNFEIVPVSLFNYLELELISQNELVIYLKLLQLFNDDYGYAFPTIPHLMIYTGIGSKATIHNCLDNLEDVGLLKKAKANRGNNIYVVFKPLDQDDLYKAIPENVNKYEKKKTKLLNMNEYDKERFKQHLLNKIENDNKIQAKQIVPKVSKGKLTKYDEVELSPEEKRKIDILSGIKSD